MFKKLFLIAIVFAVTISWFSGILSVSFSPFSVTIHQSGKDFLKHLAIKVKNLVYFEATEYNPEGDLIPDQIDDEIKREIKERLN